MKYPFTKEGVIALIASLAIIAGAAYWFVTYGPSRTGEEPAGTEEAATYVKEDELGITPSSTTEEIEDVLLNAFAEGNLMEVVSYDNPLRENERIVFASPTFSGSEEEIDCGIQGHRYCGLYRSSPEGNDLLMLGMRLAGFSGVERFIDADHAIIATAWTLGNYTSIERKQLDLRTGELVPVLIVELDTGYDFGELQASGYGGYVSLYVEGEHGPGTVIPSHIILRDENGETVYELPRDDVRAFAKSIEDNPEERSDPIFVYPSDADVETLTLQLELYEMPYELDLNEQKLVRLMSTNE